jgi:hypothetical protein
MPGFALKATMSSIVALTTTLIGPIAVFGPANPPAGRSPNASIRQPHTALEYRSSPGQFCLLGMPGCLSLDQKAPAPCLVSTERCKGDGKAIYLVDAQLR